MSHDICWWLLISVNSVHNGLYKGKRYFHCAPGHGAMVKYNEVKPIKTPSKTPPVKNNYMFPSWEEVKTRRKQRNEKWVLQKLSQWPLGCVVGNLLVWHYIVKLYLVLTRCIQFSYCDKNHAGAYCSICISQAAYRSDFKTDLLAAVYKLITETSKEKL